jgi:hypothetical protein
LVLELPRTHPVFTMFAILVILHCGDVHGNATRPRKAWLETRLRDNPARGPSSREMTLSRSCKIWHLLAHDVFAFLFPYFTPFATLPEARDKSTIPRECDSRRIQFPWAGLLHILTSSSLREPALRIANRVPTSRFTPCVAHCMTQDYPSCQTRGPLSCHVSRTYRCMDVKENP